MRKGPGSIHAKQVIFAPLPCGLGRGILSDQLFGHLQHQRLIPCSDCGCQLNLGRPLQQQWQLVVDGKVEVDSRRVNSRCFYAQFCLSCYDHADSCIKARSQNGKCSIEQAGVVRVPAAGCSSWRLTDNAFSS